MPTTTTPWTLAELEAAIRAGWSAGTSEPADTSRIPWTTENPAWGQCDITALVVQDLIGGDLVLSDVFHEGRQEGYHWGNLLPGGVLVDLTREQFRRGEVVTPGRIVKRPPGRLRRRWAEYQLLRQRVIEKLGPLPGTIELDGGRQLSYTDHGGPGAPLLALHGHFHNGRTWDRLAAGLGPGWRLITLDQRGHGASDRAAQYDREGYLADAAALLERLGVGPAVVLGHSLGGVNAYQLAARRPDLVRGLVVEDIGAVVDTDLSFALDWPRRGASREEFLTGLGDAARFLGDSLREYEDGWGTAFVPEDMVVSQQLLNGDHWADWLAVRVPTLLVRGERSDCLSAGHAREMAARRPGVRLVELPAGHVVHADDPEGFGAAVGEFLGRL
ncbi:alpha/beta fold hydrolase [Streptomyces sp. WAC06614]|uniref:alpha/beta fold hydrolase n=1 Tax=Streptomyces sp. WAC06614 TaxID=2487416 RepID=UPI000F7B5D1E|nr:alpha/beta hydrolase [Streptomyces sp. WAC06614]RSS52198.1 alpha/beta hydrolase [Streptomyces sp. WAC06614]